MQYLWVIDFWGFLLHCFYGRKKAASVGGWRTLAVARYGLHQAHVKPCVFGGLVATKRNLGGLGDCSVK